jgi:lipopolysaccharide/colanic/teichoic acid biosynthesis glycosyltransferase
VDSGATRPHAEAQEPLFQTTEDSPPDRADSAAIILVDGGSLTLLPSEAPTDRAMPAALEGPPVTPSSPRTVEIASAPPPPFTIASLARYERIERVVNIVLAALGLVVAAPLMLVIAVTVKLSSTGPIFYRQARVGLNRRGVRLHARRRSDSRWQLWARFLAMHDDLREQDLGGQVFLIYKFRTMCEIAEHDTGAVWAVKNDPRSTSIGCFLRKYRLDELPQLFNVLKGDMNIVGPRPERPSIFARLSEEIEDYPLRQRTKPGITGWAQIHLKYDSCIDDVRKKVRYDLEYLRQKSIVRDLKIMAKTLPSVLFKRRGW